ncbi:unnamed protein product [Rhizoctonia solani]|uniref:Protein kinase domain-containing protein n=1 Tax=Rhizoctonia solani TaxID=456999 RepID=A0A8H3GTE1_9AGAM|nr:unnamed protein product [Rhizoctonia solani]
MSDTNPISRSVVIVGDSCCAIFETYETNIKYHNRTMNLMIYDTSGLEDCDRLRPLSYQGRDLVIIAHNISNADSLDNVQEKWVPEADITTAYPGNRIVSLEKRSEVAKEIGAKAYLECSASTRKGVRDVFETVTRMLLEMPVELVPARSFFSLKRLKWGNKQRPVETPRDDASVPVIDLSPRITISAKMPMSKVLEHLQDHGCQDITKQLNLSASSEYPVSTGGFGDVYRGSLHNGFQVSIKCLRLPGLDSSEETRKDLKNAARELYVWSKCKHPNILELKGVALYRNQLAMVSPWMSNGDVIHFLSQNPRFDRYKLCTQIATGVAYIHGENIAHGDIKGANILISDDFTPKLSDFGNSMPVLGNQTLQFTKTDSGPGVSPRWTPPEILEERTGFTFAGDVYSLGMTFLEIMSGAVPYANMGEFAAMSRAVQRIHPDRPVEQMRAGDRQADCMWALLTDCWEYDPQYRTTATRVVEVMLSISKPGRSRYRDPGST